MLISGWDWNCKAISEWREHGIWITKKIMICWLAQLPYLVFFFLVDYNQVIYTVGRDPQYQKTVVADTGPLVTAPVVVSNVLLWILFTLSTYEELNDSSP